MREAAEQLDYDPSHLMKHFPERCRAISARYMAYQNAQKEAREHQLANETQRVTKKLHDKGIYPSLRKVQANLSHPVSIREPIVWQAWHKTLRELGYES